MLFLQQWSLAWWACKQATAAECITYCFLWNNCTCLFQVFLKLSTSGPWPLDKSSDNYFHSSVRNLVWSTWSWPVYGETMFFPLPDYGPNSAHLNIQKYRNPSATNAISMFCNNKVAKVLRDLFAFTHHEMFLVWHVGNETPFYRHQLGLNQLILISTDKGQDCFLITDRFQLVSWLSMPFCTSLSSCVQYFSPVSFYFITHNLISELICFVFFVYMDYLGCYRHLVKISCQ